MDEVARVPRLAQLVIDVGAEVHVVGVRDVVEALRTMQQTTAGFATDHVMTARVTSSPR